MATLMESHHVTSTGWSVVRIVERKRFTTEKVVKGHIGSGHVYHEGTVRDEKRRVGLMITTLVCTKGADAVTIKATSMGRKSSLIITRRADASATEREPLNPGISARKIAEAKDGGVRITDAGWPDRVLGKGELTKLLSVGEALAALAENASA